MSYSGASVDVPKVSSEFGSGRGGWGAKGQITREGIPVTNNAVDAVINVGATQAAGISIQFNNADGSPISFAQRFSLWVVGSQTTLAAATTGGSTGIAIGANGLIHKTVTAKLDFDCVTDITGLWKGTWTDTSGTEVAYLVVFTPQNRAIPSAQLPLT